MMGMREKLIELLDKASEKLKELCGGLNDHNGNGVRADHLIANDVVPVVRCKDCKYRYTAKSGLILCTQHITMTPKDDDFCSYGERKDNERKAD